MRKYFLIIFLSLVSSLLAKGKGVGEEYEEVANELTEPWYTGPILAPSGHVLPLGYGNLQPYLYYTIHTARFDEDGHKHSIPHKQIVLPQIFLQFGVTNWMDATLVTQAAYKKQEGESSFQYGDTGLNLGFQLLEAKKGSFQPDIRLIISESFPTGKYQRLNPNEKSTDQNGDGSFKTGFGLVCQKKITAFKMHPFRVRWFVSYIYRSPVGVHDLNAFGGGKGTNGTITLDPSFITILAWEFSFSQRWVFAIDMQYTIRGAAYFQGDPGFDEEGNPFQLGSKKGTEFSLAPALEYNFNANVGLLGGVWFTAYGTNTADFISYIISLNYTFPVSSHKPKQAAKVPAAH